MIHTEILELLERLDVISGGKMKSCFKRKLEKHPDDLNHLIEYTSFLQYDASLRVRIQCVIQGIIEQPVCHVCGDAIKMRESGRYLNTFAIFCGGKCTSRSASTIDKRRKTNNVRYGSTNFLASIEGRETIIATLQRKYGVNNAALIKGSAEKKKNTIIERYGSEETLNETSKAKREATMVERYGVKNPMHDEMFKELQQESTIQNENN